MREVIIHVRDDLDHSVDASETIPFSYRGVEYEIDLSDANVDLFDKSMHDFIEAARVIKPERPASSKMKPDGERAIRQQRQKVRTWARNQGYEVSQRGQIPNAIIEAYQAAHPAVRLLAWPAPAERITAADAGPVVKPKERKADPEGQRARKVIREWGKANGYRVFDTGIIAAEVAEAFAAANPAQAHLCEFVGTATGDAK